MKKTLILLAFIALFSCDKEEDFRIECATLDQGWVEITNSSGIDLLIDVTWGNNKSNNPIMVEVLRFNGMIVSTVFERIPAGTAKVWYSPNNGNNWYWMPVEVLTCDKTYCSIHEIPN
jgi:hypothetical protein